MSYLIEKWYLPDDLKNTYKPSNEDCIEDLSKVNIFIGPNNSGKSRFLRALYFLHEEMIKPSGFPSSEINDIFEKHIDNFNTLKNEAMLDIFWEYLHMLSTTKLKDSIKTKTKIIENYLSYIVQVTRIPDLPIARTIGDKEKAENFSQLLQSSNMNFRNDIMKLLKSRLPKEYKFYKIYIPVLRGLRPLIPEQEVTEDFYLNRTKYDYFQNKDMHILNFNTFTGLNLYERMKEHLLGDLDKREFIKKFEVFLSTNFFENQTIAIIPKYEGKNDVVHVKIGNEEYPIHKLGDGIQHLIIMLFPIFLNKGKDLLLFIEEPELYLHPGLQRKLLQILTDFGDNNDKENGSLQVFLTTHSNHFLDMTLDFDNISVYKFTKKFSDGSKTNAVFEIENTSNDDRNVLKCLGVNNSSVLLSNCTIWVEGITDRMYLRHYLKLYQEANPDKIENFKVFEEDKHYSFVEYSGNNITHWSFLDDESGMNVEKLCGTLLLITDKDIGKDERHEKLKESLGENYYLLTVKEIENLLTLQVIKKIMLDYGESAENIKIPKNNTAYKNRYLGKYIEDKLLIEKQKTHRRNKERPYSDKSGTIKDKTAFANKAINAIESYDDLSEEAQSLCEKIYEFIKRNNPDSELQSNIPS